MDAKRILTCAALLAGVLFLNGGLVAAVQSDIVGYTTMTMEAGKWYMIGTPFSALSDAAERKVNDAFALEGFADGDVLYTLPEGGTFSIHYWYDRGENRGWSISKLKWLPDERVLSLGEAVYIKKGTDGTLSFAGKVEAVKVPFGAEEGNAWGMVAPQWPEEKLLSDLKWENVTGNDKLYRMNADGSFSIRHWYSRNGQEGWSTSKVSWRPDSVPLAVGEAVYINKQSPAVGSISL